MDFENMKYPYFFDQAKRKAEVGKNLDDDMPNLVQKIFDELYKGEFKDKLFSCTDIMDWKLFLNRLYSGKNTASFLWLARDFSLFLHFVPMINNPTLC